MSIDACEAAARALDFFFAAPDSESGFPTRCYLHSVLDEESIIHNVYFNTHADG